MTTPISIDRIDTDLFRVPGGFVLYVEGVDDTSAFFSLIGKQKPIGSIHQNVLVTSVASGKNAVAALVGLAHTNGRKNVLGICDGDGTSLASLKLNFDPPHVGPLFHWKSYSIENILAKTAWPPHWGAPPNWSLELRQYSCYVAINRLQARFYATTRGMNLDRYLTPVAGRSLLRITQIRNALSAGIGQINQTQWANELMQEDNKFSALLQSGDLDEVHCSLNGKWLFEHFVIEKFGISKDRARKEWCDAVFRFGGALEAKSWWQRMFGQAP